MAQPSSPTFLDVQVVGLYLNPSTFGNNAPPGALVIANNVVIDRPSIVESRRGFNNTFATFNNTSIKSLYQFNNIMLAYTTDSILSAELDPINTPGLFTNYLGAYDVPDPSLPQSRIRAIETNKNFYFNTLNGVYRLDAPAGTPRLAGAPPGLYGEASPTGGSGFLPADTNVAYRVVFGYRDANRQLILGAPSGMIVARNPGASPNNVSLIFQIPKEVQLAPTDYFFQVYRGNASPNIFTEPDDDMALIYEDLCTGAVTQTITDTTPSNLRGSSLYTNVGQDGILQSNYRAPWCADMMTFKQYAFYANTRTLHSADLTLVVAGISNGADALVAGQTVTFTAADGPTFTLLANNTVNDFVTGEFTVSDTGNPAYDIQLTAANMCLVANAYAANTFLEAYYISTATDLPGKMNFTRTNLSEYTFTITTSNPGALCWEQPFPLVSLNDVKPNRIYFSKFNQPEAVPIVNYFDVGSANQKINRILPLKNGFVVMKQDGIFYISSYAPPFNVTPLDYNVRILADNTAAELDNQIYFLSDQGVVRVSDTDAVIASFILDKTIIENTSPELFPNLQATAWGIAYQSDRKYILNMPAKSAISEYIAGTYSQASLQYVYSYITQNWTTWDIPTSCGLVFKRDGKLYLGSTTNAATNMGSAPGTNSNYLYQERKSFTSEDFADNQYSSTVNTIVLPTSPTTGASAVIIINTPNLPPGVEIVTGMTIRMPFFSSEATITDVIVLSPSLLQITMDTVQFWDLVHPIVIYTPIHNEVQTTQIDCQNPGMNKQFNEIVYFFSKQDFRSLKTTISSDMSHQPIDDFITPQIRGGWGYDPWGPTPWGGNVLGQGKVRRYIPQGVQRSGWLYVNVSHAECFTSFGFSGLQLFYKVVSSRQK